MGWGARAARLGRSDAKGGAASRGEVGPTGSRPTWQPSGTARPLVLLLVDRVQCPFGLVVPLAHIPRKRERGGCKQRHPCRRWTDPVSPEQRRQNRHTESDSHHRVPRSPFETVSNLQSRCGTGLDSASQVTETPVVSRQSPAGELPSAPPGVRSILEQDDGVRNA